MKTKLKLKIKSKRSVDQKASNHISSDFIWSGEDQIKTTQEGREHFSSDISSIVSRWNKQMQDNNMGSPAKRHSDIWQVPRQGTMGNKTSTPILKHKSLDFQSQINAFKEHFECGPDFKIYDDYNYLSTPKKDVSYRNLVAGNTPAPPLPPRNRQGSRPPVAARNCKLECMRRFPVNPLSISFS